MKYASLKQNTWMYRRHYPVDVKRILGRAALKQSLKTGDIKVAKERVTELNLRFDDTVRRVRAGLVLVDQQPDWAKSMTSTLKALDWAPVAFQDLRRSPPVGPLAKEYLRLKARKLQPGGYKAVRYSVGLFASRHQDTLKPSRIRREEVVEVFEAYNASIRDAHDALPDKLARALGLEGRDLEKIEAACDELLEGASQIAAEFAGYDEGQALK